MSKLNINMKKLIAISERNYQRLVNYGKMTESFDDVVGQILDIVVGGQKK